MSGRATKPDDNSNIMWCFLVIIGIIALVALILGWYAAANVPKNSDNDIAVFCFHGVRQDNILESQEDPLPTDNPLIVGSISLKDSGTRLCWDLQYISNIAFACSTSFIGFFGPVNLTDPGTENTIQIIKDMGFILNAGFLKGCHSISRSVSQSILENPPYFYMHLGFNNFEIPDEIDGCLAIIVRGYLSGICHAPFFHSLDDDDDNTHSHSHSHSHSNNVHTHASSGRNFDSQSNPSRIESINSQHTARSPLRVSEHNRIMKLQSQHSKKQK